MTLTPVQFNRIDLTWSCDCNIVLCVNIYNSAAATLTSPGLVCLGERATFSCTIMDIVLLWRYNGVQVGPSLVLDTTPAQITPDPVGGITFAVDHISNNGGILVSTLSFNAVMATNGQTISCSGDENRNDTTILLGSGKDHQPYTCSQ